MRPASSRTAQAGKYNTPGHLHAVLVKHVHAEAVRGTGELVHDKIHSQVVFKEVDAGCGLGCGDQGTLDLSAGQVRCVHDPPHAVAALLRQVQGAVLVAGELRSHGDQLKDTSGALTADNVHSSAVVEAWVDFVGVSSVGVGEGVRVVGRVLVWRVW